MILVYCVAVPIIIFIGWKRKKSGNGFHHRIRIRHITRYRSLCWLTSTMMTMMFRTVSRRRIWVPLKRVSI